MSEQKDLQFWVKYLTESELPVLKQTARDLAALRQDENKLSVVAIAEVIARDPIVTVKLLRYLQRHKHKAQTSDVVQVEQALLMLGIEPFFAHIPLTSVAEDLLKNHMTGLPPLLRVVHRSHRASQYAMDWACMLHDMHFEEVRVAALLHDIAEILMWCFAPEKMLEIRAIQQQDKALRSQQIQQHVLGFSLLELQKELVIQWELPKLLLDLLNDDGSYGRRERKISLAINLARHSANGWDDAALPDDYTELAALLSLPVAEVIALVGGNA